MTPQQVASPDGLTAHVASEIRATMGRLNVKRAELARRIGVEDSWVGKRLNGRTEISLTDLDRIATALGVGIVDLLPRDRRQQVTGWYPTTVSGTVPHPRHPIVAGAVPLEEIRHGDARRERRIGRKVDAATTSTERITSMSFAATA